MATIVKKILSIVRSKKFLVSLGITVAYVLFGTFVLDRMAFHDISKNVRTYLMLKAEFFVVLFAAVYFLVHFVSRIRTQDKRYREWLKFGALYCALLAILLLCIWPGLWVWDEFFILEAAKNFVFEPWQSYLTIQFYSYCLMLFPSGITIVLVQTLFASFVVGYIVSGVKAILPKLFWLAYIPFLLPVVLINNFYPLRMTMYSYLEVWLFAFLLFSFYKKASFRIATMLGVSVLLVVLILWRTEAIFYLLLGPILVLVTFWHHLRPKKFLAFLFVFLVLFGGTYFYTNLRQTPYTKIQMSRYAVTAYINPLSIMLQGNLNQEHLAERLKGMSGVLNIEEVKAAPDYNEIPSFWSGKAVREGFQDHMGEFLKNYILFIAENPGSFLRARLKTFFATSGLDAKTHPGNLGTLTSHLNGTFNQHAQDFLDNNMLVHPLSNSLRNKGVNFFVNPHSSFNRVVFWNFLPQLVLLAGVLLWSFFKKHWPLALLALAVFARVGLVFLTAPANYFFYYLSVYLCASFLVIFLVIHFVNTRKKQEHTVQQ